MKRRRASAYATTPSLNRAEEFRNTISTERKQTGDNLLTTKITISLGSDSDRGAGSPRRAPLTGNVSVFHPASDTDPTRGQRGWSEANEALIASRSEVPRRGRCSAGPIRHAGQKRARPAAAPDTICRERKLVFAGRGHSTSSRTSPPFCTGPESN